MNKEKAKEIINILMDNIENPATELIYSSNFELLVAVILSAQCTDKRVNMVTKDLFKKYNTPQDFAKLEVEELGKLIHPCGFYHNKAKNIIACSKKLCENFGGEIPNDFESLCSLPGVGRKTANVMLIVAFKTPAIPVDTHVFRVSNRLGLANANNVLETEKQLAEVFSDCKELWEKIHHLLILFGRYNCKAINPKCDGCVLKDYCKYYKEKFKG